MIPQKSSHAGERVALSVLTVVAPRTTVVSAREPTLLVTMESAVAKVSCDGVDLTLDRSGFVVVPRGARVTLRASASASRVAALALREPLFAKVARTYAKLGVDRSRLGLWMGRLELLPRTVWVHEIVHRYVFERYALGEADNAATRFLETEILKEVYFLFRDRAAGADRATSVRKYSASVERALAYVEAHLFDASDARALARHARASESTLLRAFRRELGRTPAAYWRGRKLDEALVLLRAGRHSVFEVSTIVGYDNPTAFAFAFRQRFGGPPSAFVPRGRSRPPP
jgi:AraC-like DNA-binding protein